jgi:hypothetical protein
MGRVYSTQLFNGALTPGTDVEYVVPSGYTVVVRDIQAFNATAASEILFVMNVNLGSGVVLAPPATGALSESWNGRVVVLAGQTIYFGCIGAQVDAIVSGYLLSA